MIPNKGRLLRLKNLFVEGIGPRLFWSRLSAVGTRGLNETATLNASESVWILMCFDRINIGSVVEWKRN